MQTAKEAFFEKRQAEGFRQYANVALPPYGGAIVQRSHLSIFLSSFALFLTGCPTPPVECEGQTLSLANTMVAAEVAVVADYFELGSGDEIPECKICEYISENLYDEILEAKDCTVSIDWEAEEVTGSYTCSFELDHCDDLAVVGEAIPLPESTLVENDCGAYDAAKSIVFYGPKTLCARRR